MCVPSLLALLFGVPGLLSALSPSFVTTQAPALLQYSLQCLAIDGRADDALLTLVPPRAVF